MKCELKIFYDKSEKEALIDEMNFKYRYDLDLPVPLIEIMGIEAMIPDDDLD